MMAKEKQWKIHMIPAYDAGKCGKIKCMAHFTVFFSRRQPKKNYFMHKLKENEWKISSHKLPHLPPRNELLGVLRLARFSGGHIKRRKNIFNINAHIYKGEFNKWMKFICT
jgi:hypothetical protein